MRLKQIKLAGFKSFVDPTTVSFPGNRCAIVGPNGCGKSNIIDAVRWVMGESSARQLRGESITDVIFNGSTSRKPTALASIELSFDNSDGRIGGEYAEYARNRDPSPGDARRAVRVFPERHQVSSPRHHGHLPGHRVRSAQLLDHRAGHDQPAGRGEAGRPAGLSRGSGRDLQVQGAPPRNRESDPAHRGEPRAAERHTRGADAAARPPAAPGPRRRALSRIEGRGAARPPPNCMRCGWSRSKRRCTRAKPRSVRSKSLSNARSPSSARSTTTSNAAGAQHTEHSDEFNKVQGRYYQLGADIARIEEAITYNQQRVDQLETRSRLGIAAAEARPIVSSRWTKSRSLTLRDRVGGGGVRASRPRAPKTSDRTSRSKPPKRDSNEWQASWESFNERAAANRARVRRRGFAHRAPRTGAAAVARRARRSSTTKRATSSPAIPRTTSANWRPASRRRRASLEARPNSTWSTASPNSARRAKTS